MTENTLTRRASFVEREASSPAKAALLERRTITRGMLFAMIITLFSEATFARPNLGDREWMRRFREFIKAFNSFLEVLNEGKFDVSKWNAIRAVWKDLDVTQNDRTAFTSDETNRCRGPDLRSFLGHPIRRRKQRS
jgi:hypothetical protein